MVAVEAAFMESGVVCVSVAVQFRHNGVNGVVLLDPRGRGCSLVWVGMQLVWGVAAAPIPQVCINTCETC